ncbi:hypothetical protein ACOME3_010785 [Neoechinorhynchus agilis]
MPNLREELISEATQIHKSALEHQIVQIEHSVLTRRLNALIEQREYLKNEQFYLRSFYDSLSQNDSINSNECTMNKVDFVLNSIIDRLLKKTNRKDLLKESLSLAKQIDSRITDLASVKASKNEVSQMLAELNELRSRLNEKKQVDESEVKSLSPQVTKATTTPNSEFDSSLNENQLIDAMKPKTTFAKIKQSVELRKLLNNISKPKFVAKKNQLNFNTRLCTPIESKITINKSKPIGDILKSVCAQSTVVLKPRPAQKCSMKPLVTPSAPKRLKLSEHPATVQLPLKTTRELNEIQNIPKNRKSSSHSRLRPNESAAAASNGDINNGPGINFTALSEDIEDYSLAFFGEAEDDENVPGGFSFNFN